MCGGGGEREREREGKRDSFHYRNQIQHQEQNQCRPEQIISAPVETLKVDIGGGSSKTKHSKITKLSEVKKEKNQQSASTVAIYVGVK